MSSRTSQPEDRLSDLTDGAVEIILDHLPVQDAARTCTLSKSWLDKWTNHPYINLDKAFYLKLVPLNCPGMGDGFYLYSRAVNLVLASHSGPILKFELYVPPCLPHEYLHTWIKHVCEKGVKKLNLTNPEDSDVYLTPFSVYDSTNLQSLMLQNFLLNPLPVLRPHTFPELTNLELVDTVIGGDVSFAKLNCLSLTRCTGVSNLGLNLKGGKLLERLMLLDNDEHDWEWLKNTPKVCELYLRLNPDCTVTGRTYLHNLLANMQKMHSLHINGFSLQLLDPTPATLMRPTTLKTLNMDLVRCYDLRQISTALSLIRSSPQLENLSITLLAPMEVITNPEGLTTETSTSIMLYEELGNTSLGELYSVRIEDVLGSPADLQLIKFLLESSPSLRSMLLILHVNIGPGWEMKKISEQVEKFHKASATVLLTWLQ